MRKRFSRRLAGYTAINLALVTALAAADYKGGLADSGTAWALALEDSRGVKAIFAQAEFRITQAVADLVAVQIIRQYNIDRAGLLLHWSGIGARPAQPGDLVAAISQAINAMAPATVRYAHRGVSVWAGEGERCLATLSPDGALGTEGCWKDGAEISGGIRAAFQMVEPAHGLQRRGEIARSFPVQAIGLGKVVTVLAMSGEAAIPEGVNPRGLIFAPFSNESSPPPRDARMAAAVQRVLARAR